MWPQPAVPAPSGLHTTRVIEPAGPTGRVLVRLSPPCLLWGRGEEGPAGSTCPPAATTALHAPGCDRHHPDLAPTAVEAHHKFQEQRVSGGGEGRRSWGKATGCHKSQPLAPLLPSPRPALQPQPQSSGAAPNPCGAPHHPAHTHSRHATQQAFRHTTNARSLLPPQRRHAGASARLPRPTPPLQFPLAAPRAPLGSRRRRLHDCTAASAPAARNEQRGVAAVRTAGGALRGWPASSVVARSLRRPASAPRRPMPCAGALDPGPDGWSPVASAPPPTAVRTAAAGAPLNLSACQLLLRRHGRLGSLSALRLPPDAIPAHPEPDCTPSPKAEGPGPGPAAAGRAPARPAHPVQLPRPLAAGADGGGRDAAAVQIRATRNRLGRCRRHQRLGPRAVSLYQEEAARPA